ncbi:MAG: gamma-glutamyl-gamma-aminobutyrate hydrolase family protein [Alphaproteobacteria bacterium]|nr:gamma-glutamyl-gamma-aminobutyrate hydrolase family protein [Alphaproteobacteria bacterium]
MIDKPLIAVIGCNKMHEGEPAQTVKTRYLTVLAEQAGAVPLIVPSLGRPEDAAAIVARVDAVLLTGSVSNVSPAAYGGGVAHEPFDPARDRTALALIRAARHFGVPVTGICRGFQEINVALGGSLRDERDAGTSVHHVEDEGDLEAEFAHGHEVTPAPASLLARLVGTGPVIVNSVHHQLVDRLGEGLRVEATAADGVVEAIASREADPLIFAVQWHPEWRPQDVAHHIAFWRFVGERARRAATSRAEGLAPGSLEGV